MPLNMLYAMLYAMLYDESGRKSCANQDYF